MKKKLLLLTLATFALTLHAQPPTVTIDRVCYTILEQEGYSCASSPVEDPGNLNNEDIIIRKSVEYNGKEYPITRFYGYFYANEGQKICFPEGLVEIVGGAPNAVIEVVPQSVERLLQEAFYGVTLPKELYLQNVKIIGPWAFLCEGLENLRIGASLELLGCNAFSQSLKELVLDDGVSGVPLALTWNSLSCLSQKEFKIPYRSPLTLSDCLMEHNKSVERIVFPDVEEIEYGGANSFSNLSLTVYIYGFFFRNCSALKEIVCLGETPPEITNLELINTYPFNEATEFNIMDNIDQCILKVPAGSEQAYRNHPIWGKFKTILGFENGDYTSISSVPSADSNDAAPVYYNLQGIKVSNPAKGQLYIRTIGSKAEKVIF